MMPTSTTAMTTENISATLSHGGSFIQYNIFEVTAKYKPPILPIVKGAYGIVCSALNSETNEHVALKKIANVFDNKIDAKRTLHEIKLFIVVDSDFLNYWRLELLFGCIVQLVLHIIFELLAS